MKHNVVAPSVGESITEVSILKWAKQNGQQVKAGELLLEIESDKATVEIVAESDGRAEDPQAAGERIPIGEVIGDDRRRGDRHRERRGSGRQVARRAAPASAARQPRALRPRRRAQAPR